MHGHCSGFLFSFVAHTPFHREQRACLDGTRAEHLTASPLLTSSLVGSLNICPWEHLSCSRTMCVRSAFPFPIFLSSLEGHILMGR